MAKNANVAKRSKIVTVVIVRTWSSLVARGALNPPLPRRVPFLLSTPLLPCPLFVLS